MRSSANTWETITFTIIVSLAHVILHVGRSDFCKLLKDFASGCDCALGEALSERSAG
jgi:hypothetical protein